MDRMRVTGLNRQRRYIRNCLVFWPRKSAITKKIENLGQILLTFYFNVHDPSGPNGDRNYAFLPRGIQNYVGLLLWLDSYCSDFALSSCPTLQFETAVATVTQAWTQFICLGRSRKQTENALLIAWKYSPKRPGYHETDCKIKLSA